jgi:superfamily I DNA/RNA helicase
MITCDGLQGIYARKRFYWSDVGIQARGRVKRFEKSYRTPIEIGFLAQEALPRTIKDLIGQFDEFIPTKEFVGTHGTVEIIISNSREEEYMRLVKRISNLLETPREILVLFRKNLAKMDYNHPFCNLLKKLNIEWKDLQKYYYNTPGLLIGTLHGTKGLESDTIIIPEIDTYITDKDRQLLYVGITRARKMLILSSNKQTGLIKLFEPYQT